MIGLLAGGQDQAAIGQHDQPRADGHQGGAAQAAVPQVRGQVAEPLVASIGEQAQAMLRLIENLLDLARLQAQGVELKRQWHSLEEIPGTALRELREPLRAHPVAVDLPADFPLPEVEATLYVERPQYLRVHMANLRHKLEDDPTQPKHLVTELQVGYRLAGA